MPTMPHTNYREILRRELESRCAKNPRYSLRSFARDLDMLPSRLSDVMKGRYGLSLTAAEKVAKRLGLSPTEIRHFCDQVESNHARNQRKRQAALARIAETESYRALSLDSFELIANWYHYAILEICLTQDFNASPAWIAKQLGISQHVASAAVNRLIRLDLLVEKDGTLTPTEGFTASPDGIPSDAIRKFHREILEKAIRALDFQTVTERDFSSMITAIDDTQLADAKADIKIFRRHFDKKYGSGRKKNKVYCLSTQLFRLQESQTNSGDEK